MCDKITKELSGYLKASYPLIYVTSSEEERLERIIGKVCNAPTSNGERVCSLFVWEEGVGIKAGHDDLADDPRFAWDKIAEATKTLPQFIMFITQKSDEAIEAANHPEDHPDGTHWDNAAFLAKDLHYLFKNPSPVLYRALRIFARNAKVMGQSLIAIGPTSTLPEELAHEFVVLDLELPDKADIKKALVELGESLIDSGQEEGAGVLKLLKGKNASAIIDASKGMTESEVVGSAALSLVQSGKLDREFITEQKVAAIKKSGSLEIWPAEAIGHVGGMGAFKEFLHITSKAFSKKARSFGLNEPKGALVVGVPGTGKSLGAKAAASLFQRPLVRFDVGSVKGSLVGDSEKNMRNALKTIDAAAPCVLFIDEVEKGFAGAGGSNDSGVSAGIFGQFLSWMQDHESEVYVIATANNVDSLPPEFLRSGRFDEIFFSDLPTDAERKEIFEIHLTKVKRDPKSFGLAQLVEASRDYSGAEIEQVVQDALGHAFSEDADDVTDTHLLEAIKRTKPLAVTRKGDIDKMRERGKRDFRSASNEVRKTGAKTIKKGRKIQTTEKV